MRLAKAGVKCIVSRTTEYRGWVRMGWLIRFVLGMATGGLLGVAVIGVVEWGLVPGRPAASVVSPADKPAGEAVQQAAVPVPRPVREVAPVSDGPMTDGPVEIAVAPVTPPVASPLSQNIPDRDLRPQAPTNAAEVPDVMVRAVAPQEPLPDGTMPAPQAGAEAETAAPDAPVVVSEGVSGTAASLLETAKGAAQLGADPVPAEVPVALEVASAVAPVTDPVTGEAPDAPLFDGPLLDGPLLEAPQVGAIPQADAAPVLGVHLRGAETGLPPLPRKNGPAFDAFAAKIAVPAGKPLLAVILEDVGAQGVERANLTSLGAQITFAIAAERPEIARRSDAVYRSAGFEVVALVPGGGARTISARTPEGDVENYLDAYFKAVPGAVALLDRANGSLAENGLLLARLEAELSRDGRPLLLPDAGDARAALAAADQARLLPGLPPSQVFRVIDETRAADEILAMLRAASAEAEKNGAAVVYGRTYPETIAALITWQNSRAGRAVALAPLTAAMARVSLP